MKDLRVVSVCARIVETQLGRMVTTTIEEPKGCKAVCGLPGEVPGVSAATQVSGSNLHTCALLSSGHIDCWGWNENGQLGNGTTGKEQNTPVEVQGVSDATQVSAGFMHTCALLSSDRIACWGDDEDGQLGYVPTKKVQDTPVEVQDL